MSLFGSASRVAPSLMLSGKMSVVGTPGARKISGTAFELSGENVTTRLVTWRSFGGGGLDSVARAAKLASSKAERTLRSTSRRIPCSHSGRLRRSYRSDSKLDYLEAIRTCARPRDDALDQLDHKLLVRGRRLGGDQHSANLAGHARPDVEERASLLHELDRVDGENGPNLRRPVRLDEFLRRRIGGHSLAQCLAHQRQRVRPCALDGRGVDRKNELQEIPREVHNRDVGRKLPLLGQEARQRVAGDLARQIRALAIGGNEHDVRLASRESRTRDDCERVQAEQDHDDPVLPRRLARERRPDGRRRTGQPRGGLPSHQWTLGEFEGAERTTADAAVAATAV